MINVIWAITAVFVGIFSTCKFTNISKKIAVGIASIMIANWIIIEVHVQNVGWFWAILVTTCIAMGVVTFKLKENLDQIDSLQ